VTRPETVKRKMGAKGFVAGNLKKEREKSGRIKKKPGSLHKFPAKKKSPPPSCLEEKPENSSSPLLEERGTVAIENKVYLVGERWLKNLVRDHQGASRRPFPMNEENQGGGQGEPEAVSNPVWEKKTTKARFQTFKNRRARPAKLWCSAQTKKEKIVRADVVRLKKSYPKKQKDSCPKGQKKCLPCWGRIAGGGRDSIGKR